MTSSASGGHFDGLEPSVFPDLTGLSPLGKENLSGHGTANFRLTLSWEDLEKFQSSRKASLSALCLAAWTKVLVAYQDERDVCLSLASAASEKHPENASSPSQPSLYPLRASLSSSTTHSGLVADLDQQLLSQSDRALPGDGSDIGSERLFDTCVQVSEPTDLPEDASLVPNLNSLAILLQIHAAKDFSWLDLSIHFKRSVLLQEDTQHLFSTFEAAFASLINFPDSSALSWSRTQSYRPSIANQLSEPSQPEYGETVVDAFEHHSRHRPDDVALDFLESDGSRTIWTFRQLHELGATISTYLVVEMGIRAEESVPLCIPKSPALYASILGVMMSGATFTPFSDAPEDRKAFMLEELGSRVVLHVDDEDLSWCQTAKTVNVSVLLSAAKSQPNAANETQSLARPENLVYQMYTSGSTGRPKAVSLEHRNVVQTVAASRSLVPWKRDSRMLQYAAPSFDMCYYDTFLAWYLGICLCSASSNAVYNDLAGVIDKLSVSMLGLTPSVASTLDPVKVPTVEWLYCIGEAMPQSLVTTWSGKLVNSYGPTEAAQMVTLFPVRPEIKSTVIGAPFGNTTFSVHQKDSTDPVPVMGAGELYIGGSQVAREYFANDVKTKLSFSEREGSRFYKTGDAVRMLGNGNFEFIGRYDDQVKIRGQRVELGEINEAIKESSSRVKNVSSQIMKPTSTSKDQLVTFIEAIFELDEEDQSSLRQAISMWLASRLPSYMIPKLFIFVDRIPLSAAGKVNKQVLKQLLQDHTASGAGSMSFEKSQPNSGSIDTVRKILSDFSGIGVSEIGDDTTIYHLGLDSISAIQMSSAFDKEGMALIASDILNHPTARELAKVLDAGSEVDPRRRDVEPAFDFPSFSSAHESAVVSTVRIDRSGIASIRPATSLQAGMLSMSIHSSGSMYFNHMLYAFPSDLDVVGLHTAWKAVVAKYDILRSGFVHVEDKTHPWAMITYKAEGFDAPINTLATATADISSQQADMVKVALEALHVPPWRVWIQPGQMLLSAHHALYDAQVLNLVLRDLQAACIGSTLEAATPLEQQLAWRLGASSSEKGSTEFWKGVGEKAFVTRFPCVTPLKVETKEAGEVSLTCRLSQTELETGCRAQGITMQVAGQTSWGRLISAYTGEHEVTFGTVLSGRTTEESEQAGLPCITTVPVAVHAGKSKRDLLNDLMHFNASLQPHQFVPLKHIERAMGHSNESLFDTIFTYQKRPTSFDETTVFKFVKNKLAIDYPLSIEMEPAGDNKLELRLYHRLDRVPVEQAQLIIEQFNDLLCETLSVSSEWDTPNVECANKKLYSITAPEYASLEHEAKVLHEFVDISTRQTPGKAALEFVYDIPDTGAISRKLWTYEELALESNRFANMLRQEGVQQCSVVAVCFDKCPEAAFAMLGISKLGCSFLALDSSAPLERKKFIMKDSKAAALVTKGVVVAGLEELVDVPILNLDNIDPDAFPDTVPRLERPIDPQDLSYCLYTSGTTGTPKGCAITHENVVQAFLSFHKLYRWNDHSRWLQFASYHFDVSVMEHFWSWSVGMTVVVASRDLVFADLAGTIKKLDITHTDLTPSLARLLDPADVPSLAGGVFVTGGEMLRQEVIDNFGPHGAIHNAYGPTEATIGCTMYPGVPRDGKPSNIGRHFPVAGSFIVNPQDPTKPVLRGAVGEFVVSGKLVSQGYIGRPDLTRQKFIMLGGQRCYRTGDLVRILHNQTFDFVGRADDQVKLRGQRLEIGEINSVIKGRTKEVVDVTTQVLKHPKQQKEQLISFVVLSGSGSQDKTSSYIMSNNPPRALLSDLKHACNEKLPQYMVPTHILPINKLPLSANNKADAKQLKQLYENTGTEVLQSLSQKDDAYTSSHSSSEEEEKIKACLSDMLDVSPDQIYGNSSFFELGLDSISVIGFARKLRATGLAKVTTAAIMESSTPSRLAKALLNGSGSGSTHQDGSIQAAKQKVIACHHQYRGVAATVLSVSQDEIESVAPCTPLQQGIISRALNSDNEMYYGAFHFNLRTGVDLERLQNAFQRVVANVQILRTKFISTNEGHIQAVLRHSELPWMNSTVSNDQVEAHLQGRFDDWRKLNDEVIAQPVEVLISRTGTSTVLTLHMFHACYDGNSLPLLVECLLGEYHGARKVEYGPAYHEVLPYGPLRQARASKDFWAKHLKSVGSLQSLRFQALTDNASNVPISITRDIAAIEGLESCRRKLNVTPQALFQACWGIILQEAASGPLVQGLVVSGRSIDFEGADKTIGPLFNTIPFFLDIKEDDTWGSIAQQCHNFNTASLSFQHTPLRDIQKWILPRRTSNDSTLFETLFVFQKKQAEEELPAIWEFRSDQFEADYPLALEIDQSSDDSFSFSLVTQAGISNEQTSHRLLEKLESALKVLVTDPSAPLSATAKVHAVLAVSDEDPTNPGAAHTNGKFNGYLNGHMGPSPNGTAAYSWADEERIVRDEIAQLAGVDPEDLYPQTSILELGLDSVDAVKLSTRLNRTAGIKIAVSAIMRLLTVGEIAASGSRLPKEVPAGSGYDKYAQLKSQLSEYAHSVGLRGPDVEDVLPSTPLQEGMVADMLSSDLRNYFNHDILKLHTDVNIQNLKEAWQQVVDATPILRTRFVEIDDPSIEIAVAQVVQRTRPLVWSEDTIEDENSFDSVLDNIRQAALQSLEKWPLFRLKLLKQQGGEYHYLVLSLSHAMYDGWSLGLLHADVNEAYKHKLPRRSSCEPALQNIIDSLAEDSASYWRQALQDTTTSTFPLRGTAHNGTPKTNRSEVCCDQSAADVQYFCKTHKTTVAAFSQTIWAFVLSSRLQNLDVAFAMVLSGRDDVHANDVLFPTMNTVISRNVIHGSRVEMMHYVQNNLATMSDHQHFPLRKALAIAKARSNDELVNSLFIYQKQPDVSVAPSDALYHSVSGHADEGIPVAVEAEIADGKVIWRIAAKNDFLSSEETCSILDDLTATTTEIIRHPDADAASFDGGKVSVCGLPAFIHGSKSPATNGVSDHANVDSDDSPLTGTEAQVQSVVAMVAKLDVSEVKSTSSLLSLGLDSISAIKVSALLRRSGLGITVNELLKAETVMKIASQVRHIAGQNGEISRQPEQSSDHARTSLERVVQPLLADALQKSAIPSEDVEETLPASPGQILMLSKWQQQGLYLPTLVFDIGGAKDVDTVVTAWQKLVGESPILRTIFVSSGNSSTPVLQLVVKNSKTKPAMVVSKDKSIDLAVSDFVGQNIESGKSSTPAALFLQSDESGAIEARLRLSHALYDGYSINQMFERLQNLLGGNTSTTAAPFASYRSFLAKTINDTDARRRYWSRYLSDLKRKSLPHHKSSSATRFHVVRPNIVPQMPRIHAFARKEGLTIQSLFVAVYARLYATLASAGNGDDIVIGAYVANRSFDGADELDAPTLGFVPLRVRNPHQRSLTEIAKQLQKDLREIAQDTRGSVSMHELGEWLGSTFTIDTWVNLILENDSAGEGSGKPAIKFSEDRVKKDEQFEVVSNVEDRKHGLFLQGNAACELYPDSIDIDGTISADAMDIGVLAPNGLIDREGIKKNISDLAHNLAGCVDGHL